MKKINLFVLCLTLVFASCGKDDVEKEVSKPELDSELIGKWIRTAKFQDDEVQELSDCEKTTFYEFTSSVVTHVFKALNGATGVCQIDSEDTGSWIEEGDKLTMTFTSQGETYTSIETFTIVDDVLTLTSEEAGYTFKNVYDKM